MCSIQCRSSRFVRYCSEYSVDWRHRNVTRACLSKICVLLNLAPDIQERLLFFEPAQGNVGISERNLRPVSTPLNWQAQREILAAPGASSLHP